MMPSTFKLKLVFGLMAFLFCQSCKNEDHSNQLKKVDIALNRLESQNIRKDRNQKLDSLRKFINKDEIDQLSKFYRLKYFFLESIGDLKEANRYLDSANNLFDNKDLVITNKISYYNTLLLNGDAFFLQQKYTKAVIYFLEAKSFQEKNLDNCEDRELSRRLGNVFYTQRNFLKAARYFKKSYTLEQSCNYDADSLKKFNNMQAILNNTGYCYECAEKLDSAAYFYQLDIDYIAKAEQSGKIDGVSIADSKAGLLDNLGSIYLKSRKFSIAEDFLKRSLATPYSGGNSVKIPPLIKLANLYTITGKFAKADSCFLAAGFLLKSNSDINYELRWYQFRSDFYAKKENFKQALSHQITYEALKDSIARSGNNLSSINIEKDFANLEQKYTLQSLEKKNSVKTTYLLFAICLLALVLIISFLIYRNSIQSKKNSLAIMLHNNELKETLLKLEDANQNYARIMRVMAHDLKNPLSGIAGITSLMIKDNTGECDIEAMSIINSSAENALVMIDEMLNSFLFAPENIIESKQDFDITLTIKQCVALLLHKAGEKGQKIIFPATQPVTIHANKEKIWRVVNNIVVNAIKFSGVNTAIEISLRDQIDTVIIAVADRGIGIPLEIGDRIYDFFTTAKREGTAGEKPYGLGLSISKQIIDGHQGKIWFENNPKGGTIFFVQLPIG